MTPSCRQRGEAVGERLGGPAPCLLVALALPGLFKTLPDLPLVVGDTGRGPRTPGSKSAQAWVAFVLTRAHTWKSLGVENKTPQPMPHCFLLEKSLPWWTEQDRDPEANRHLLAAGGQVGSRDESQVQHMGDSRTHTVVPPQDSTPTGNRTSNAPHTGRGETLS